jgi:hypothetical protein
LSGDGIKMPHLQQAGTLVAIKKLMRLFIIIFFILLACSCGTRPDISNYTDYIKCDLSVFNNRTDSLNGQKYDLYYDALQQYFVDTVGTNEIKENGDILIIGEPNSFHGPVLMFRVNNKPFYFENPPYFQSKLRKGRRIYLIDHERTGTRLNDSLIITIYKHDLVSKKDDFRKDKSLVFKAIYCARQDSAVWTCINKFEND